MVICNFNGVRRLAGRQFHEQSEYNRGAKAKEIILKKESVNIDAALKAR